MLALAAAIFGEFRGFHIQAVSRGAWYALAYLIVAGSIVGFTAYVWLIHHESPTKVGTYAYVNPVVAVIVGYFLGGETVGPRTLLGTLLVLVSVIVITTTRAREARRRAPRETAGRSGRTVDPPPFRSAIYSFLISHSHPVNLESMREARCFPHFLFASRLITHDVVVTLAGRHRGVRRVNGGYFAGFTMRSI